MTSHLRIASSLLAVFCAIGLSQPAQAHTEGACKEDAKKLCADTKPGGGAIRDCLKLHEDALSQGCKDNIAESKEKFQEKKKELVAACKQDLQQYCANVTPGQGREFSCLRAYEDKLSAGCKEKMMAGKGGMRHHNKEKGAPPPPSGH